MIHLCIDLLEPILVRRRTRDADIGAWRLLKAKETDRGSFSQCRGAWQTAFFFPQTLSCWPVLVDICWCLRCFLQTCPVLFWPMNSFWPLPLLLKEQRYMAGPSHLASNSLDMYHTCVLLAASLDRASFEVSIWTILKQGGRARSYKESCTKIRADANLRTDISNLALLSAKQSSCSLGQRFLRSESAIWRKGLQCWFSWMLYEVRKGATGVSHQKTPLAVALLSPTI